jgi:hypothetical protein
MFQVTYGDMVARHGTAMAYDLLLTIETIAKIKDEINLADEETRFQRALTVIEQINFAIEA